MNILLILMAYRWWIAAWIGFMAVVGIIEKGRKKAPAATGIAERRTTKKPVYILPRKKGSVNSDVSNMSKTHA